MTVSHLPHPSFILACVVSNVKRPSYRLAVTYVYVVELVALTTFSGGLEMKKYKAKLELSDTGERDGSKKR